MSATAELERANPRALPTTLVGVCAVLVGTAVATIWLRLLSKPAARPMG